MRTVLIKCRVFFLFFLTGNIISLHAQDPLEKYIQQGIDNNQVLQQKNIQVDKALYALRNANSLFMPTVAILAGYQHGKGGRSIDLPIGDLMNPVYSTLNQLTGTNAFPQIENVNQYFFPQNFYDAKVRTSVALLNSDLIYNRQIQSQQVHLQESELKLYKRELIKNIKHAYYQYLSAEKALSIYDNAIVLAKESKRVNESLVNNGKGVHAYLIRSQSEIESLEAQRTKAKMQADNARMYFNFMINANLTDSVQTNHNAQDELGRLNGLITAEINVQERQELKMLNQASMLNETIITMNKRYWVPKLSGFLDLGSQASNFEVNSNSQYYFLGVQLEAPIFSGRRNTYKTRLAELDLKTTQLNSQRTYQQLQMSSGVAKNNMIASYEIYKSSLKQKEAADSYQRLIDKGYREGIYSFIEQIDANNQVTAAAIQVNLNELQMLMAIASFENETSSDK